MDYKKSTPKQNSRTVCVDLCGISVEVTRKRMKTMRLRISQDGSVHLSVPIGISDERAMLFLSSKEAWIRAHLQRIATRQASEALEGTTDLTLWGIRYRLEIRETGKRYLLSLPEADDAPVIFTVPPASTQTHRDAHLSALLAREFSSYLDSIFPKWESVTGLRALSRDVRSMKSRWGSCNTKTAHIRMNLRLVHHPKICTDYVVLHELCHLKVAHHGKDFHDLVGHYMPEWKTVRAMLNHPEASERRP